MRKTKTQAVEVLGGVVVAVAVVGELSRKVCAPNGQPQADLSCKGQQ